MLGFRALQGAHSTSREARPDAIAGVRPEPARGGLPTRSARTWNVTVPQRLREKPSGVVSGGIAVGSERPAVPVDTGHMLLQWLVPWRRDEKESYRLIPLRCWRRLAMPQSPISRGGTCLAEAMIRSASSGTCPRPAECSASRALMVHGAIRAASARSGPRRTTTNSRPFDSSECWSRSSASLGSIRR